jgi:hypothetical protein
MVLVKRRGSVRRLRRLIWERDRGVCQLCGVQTVFDQYMHVDHIYPVFSGGCDHPENLRTTCATCNLRRKRRKIPKRTECRRCRPRRRSIADLMAKHPPDVWVASESDQPPSTLTEPPVVTTRALEILETLLVANGETMERQVDRFLDLTLRVGRAEARAEMLQDERDRARKALADLAERLAGVERERDALRARRWWRFW